MFFLASLSPEFVQEVTKFLSEAGKNPASLLLAIIIVLCILAYFLFGKPDQTEGRTLVFFGLMVLAIFLVVFFKPFTTSEPSVGQNQELNANYTRLEDLLISRKFRDADLETNEVMRRVTDTEDFIELSKLDEFPCSDLEKIDNTWISASNGWFGFSTQLRIWRESGMSWDQFSKRVWDVNNDTYTNLADYWNFSFDLQSAEGQLPVWYSMGNVLSDVNENYVIRILERLDVCRK